MNISNKYPVMIFKVVDKESGKIKYTAGLSKKDMEGNYENAFFPIEFNKDVELHHKSKIQINNAWLSFYNWEFDDKKGTKFFIKCNDFELIEAGGELVPKDIEKSVSNTDAFKDFAKEIELSEEDYPF